mgnify:CR=1 FL=1
MKEVRPFSFMKTSRAAFECLLLQFQYNAPIYMLIGVIVVCNTNQYRIAGRTVILRKDVRQQTHAGNVIREPAEYAAAVSSSDDGAAFTAYGMAQIRVIKGVGIGLLHGNFQLVIFRVVFLDDRFQLLAGMIFLAQICN